MDILLWIVQIILGLSFLMFGSMKAFQYEKSKQTLPWVKDSKKGLVIFVGIAELLGGIGLILPTAFNIIPILTPIAASGIAIIMISATFLHLSRKENQSITINIVLLALAIFVAFGRF